MRLVMLVAALGLIVPIVPAAAGDCQSGARSEATSCDPAEDSADSCCSATDEPAEEGTDDCGGCPDACDCSCCGSATIVPVMYRPALLRVSILSSAPAIVWLAALSPQDAVNKLLQPPQA